jgi:uncharacterized protein YaaW (UPF0174 family)
LLLTHEEKYKKSLLNLKEPLQVKVKANLKKFKGSKVIKENLPLKDIKPKSIEFLQNSQKRELFAIPQSQLNSQTKQPHIHKDSFPNKINTLA